MIKSNKANLEALIIMVMDRAGKPNTGWSVFRKLKNDIATTGTEVCDAMLLLKAKGYLETRGADPENGYFYVRTDKIHNPLSLEIKDEKNCWLACAPDDLEDGEYLCRPDDYEDGEHVTVKDGKAYKNGKYYIYYNYQFLKISDIGE